MPIKYQGVSGKVYFVGDKIAGGGEGTIYKLQKDDAHVAKIYKPDKRSSEREEKLLCMIQTKLTADQLEEVTWPQDVIYDKEGFVGYIMPKLEKTESLTSIYSSGTDNEFDLRNRILAAINLCCAVKTIHDMGQVCGDLNPQNICVNLDMSDQSKKFHITLVDTDSYHFTSQGNTYRCEVGLGDYIAPELQKKMSGGLSLKSLPLPTYTKETDLFALAVHIFALLMNGCHPFACAKDKNGTIEHTMEQMVSSNVRDSVVAPQPIENIKDGFFPFYEKRPGITYPIYAPSFDALPAELQKLFVRTFVDGHADPSKRVEAKEWIDALKKYSSSVVHCSMKDNHYYYGHNAECPLCEVDRRLKEKFGGGGGGGSKVPPSSDDGDGGSDDIIDPPSKKRIPTWAKVACAVIALIIFGSIIGRPPGTETNNNGLDYSHEATQDSGEATTSSPKDQYNVCIQNAYNCLSASDYDNAIALCNEALSINGESQDAYYIKGKALSEKNQFADALDVLEKGVNVNDNAEYEVINENVSNDLISQLSEVKDKLDQQREKERVDNACLKYGNKIRAKMKSKNYASAVKLMQKGFEKDGVDECDKICIQNGKLVDKITKGKGFVYYVWKEYAYIGDFKDGKPSGNGMEVGYPNDTAYDGYYTVKGKFRNGYPNGQCTVYYSKYEKNNSATFKGNYKNGWENGSFQYIDKSLNGEHSDTYYFTSNMGTRKVIEMYQGEYVYAKANSGWFYYTGNKNSLKGHSTEHHGKK